MKKIYAVILVAIFSTCPLMLHARNATITILDDTRMTGDAIFSGARIEWRKDIYEPTDEGEIFFLKPAKLGVFKASDIKEIARINPSTAPEVYADIEDGSRARLVQKYRIRLMNGKTIYISDFITLNTFYIDLSTPERNRRIYLSQIKKLIFKGKPRPAASPEKIKQKQASTERITKSAGKTKVIIKTREKNPALIYLIIIVVILPAALVFLAIAFMWVSKK